MTLKDQALNALEDLAKAQINQHLDALVELALKEVAKAIPGQMDDLVIASVKAKIKDEAKKLVLNLVDKIDGQVG